MAVVAVLVVGGGAMAANFGLLNVSDRSLQLVDAAAGPAGDVGAPLVTAVSSEDGSRQVFVIDGIGTVQIVHTMIDQAPALQISSVESRPSWTHEIVAIDGGAVRVEFRSSRRAMDFEAFLNEEQRIAARFRLTSRGAPLVVTTPGDEDSSPNTAATAGEEPADDSGSDGSGPDGNGVDGDNVDTRSAGNGQGQGQGQGEPAPTTTSERSSDPSIKADKAESDSDHTPHRNVTDPGDDLHEGTWIYYEDGVYVLDNNLRSSATTSSYSNRSNSNRSNSNGMVRVETDIQVSVSGDLDGGDHDHDLSNDQGPSSRDQDDS